MSACVTVPPGAGGAALAGAVARAVRDEVEQGVRGPTRLDLLGSGPVSALVEALEPAESWLLLARALRDRALRASRAPWPEGREALALARGLDDVERRAVLRWLSDARAGDGGEQARALTAARARLGPDAAWLPALRRALQTDRGRLVLVLTWDCEIRCVYCTIPKQAGREMPLERVEQAVDLLLSSERPALELRFFGGEPVLAWEAVTHAIEVAEAAAGGRDLRFFLTSNGWGLTEERLRWLAEHPVHLQVTLDGRPETQNRFRRPLHPDGDSYVRSVADKAALLHDLGIAYDVVQVVNPAAAGDLAEDLGHLAALGFRRVQLNWAHGRMWSDAALKAFAGGLHAASGLLRSRWAAGEGPWLTNLEETLERVRTYREITVDHDGTLLANNAFLYRPEERDALTIGHLDDGGSHERYRLDGPGDEELLARSFPAAVSENNARVGAVFSHWLRWMQEQGLPDPGAAARASGGGMP